ncbi:RNA polymerase II elongation factor ELL3 isoform X2 [Macaca fascicularis]|uniref:RNA polymerase II elongation factor ELL3 isoform X2 n=2 Tax=Macaca TaxID=9539 RepID=UPI0032B045CE
MEELQEPLSGQRRLCFTPAARTSLLLLRLNDAALRALQECQRQQVRPVIAFQGHRGVSASSGCVSEVRAREHKRGLEVEGAVGAGGCEWSRSEVFPRTELQMGRGGCWGCPRGLWLRGLCCFSLLGNSGPAAPGVLTSPVGPVLVLLRLAPGGVAAAGGGGADFMGLTVSFHLQYLRLPGPGWSCLFSFIVSQCCQEGAGGSLDLVCQRFVRSGSNRLHCLGSLRERLIIWAAMDSIPAPLSVQGHNLPEDARHPESWQNTGNYSEGDVVSQPQIALEEVSVSDPLASNQGQSLPGSSREHMAQWEVREPVQALPSSASRKRLDKKRSVPVATVELEEKRFRTLPLAPSPLQGLTNQDLQEGEDWEQEDKDEDMDPRLECSSSVQEDSESPSPEDVPDYLLQYRAIRSAEQQHAYERDFETDYAEYRILHARVGTASQRFIELGAEIKRVQRGTPEYKVLEDKIVQEYKKFRKRYPGYREEKRRCEYLHQKLSHIKGLILEFEEKNRGS